MKSHCRGGGEGRVVREELSEKIVGELALKAEIHPL